ncbi:MAG TPA: hypothetical protein VMT29_12940 [Steroidobacteraceae bacterium]|nr:hypothetical protein [Steroidobacteraceae bacterium]
MNTRRTILSRVAALAGLGVAATGPSLAAGTSPPANAGSAQSRGPQSGTGDVQRLGLVPNDPGAATANANALKALVSPSGSFAGRVWFPNTTGKDVYYLDDIVPFHDGIQVDLQGCTLHFGKTSVRGDTNSGFIFAIRDFSIANGAIVVDYQATSGASNAGSALSFGNRGEDSHYFSPLYDSQLPVPMGNITVRNLRISSNNRGGHGILMIGGLEGVLMENVWIDGQGALDTGIYYEFGWATNEPQRELRQTSHAHNMRFSNIHISNINEQRGQAFGLTGAYNCWVDGLYVRSAKILLQCSPGESAYFRPWAGVDQVGAKRNIALRNIVGTHITGTAIDVSGESSKSGGYLRGTRNGPAEQTDLIDCSIDGFAIDGADLDGGYGVHSSAERLELRNGRITGFSRGIVTTQECTRLCIDSVDIFGCKQIAIQLGQQSSIWNPPRQKMGFVRNCFIAGNGIANPGNFAAIELDQCAAFVIEGNRFGYEPSHDGQPETAQGFAVRLGGQASNVVCRCNHVAGLRPGGTAFVSRSAASSGNTLVNTSGVTSANGAWDSLKR